MHFTHRDLLPWVQAGATVVTPTPLLASVIQRRYVEDQLARGQSTWQNPAVLPVGAWLQQVWREARYRTGQVPLLLSSSQERLLWEEVIAGSPDRLLDVQSAAKVCRNVANLMAEWHVPAEHPYWDNNEDARVFERWLGEVRRRCADEHWILSADLWPRIPNWLAIGGERLSRLIFAGFTEVTPVIEELAQRLSGAGIAVEFLSSQAEPVPVQPVACENIEQELDTAARWAREIVEHHPDQSIGILVPGLSEHRAAVTRHLRDVFRPRGVLDAVTMEAPPDDSIFYVHATGSLREHPLIAGAFLLLELAKPQIPLASASAILRSPFLKGAVEETNPRAQADLRLRKTRELEIPLAVLRRYAEHCPQFSKILGRVNRVLAAVPDEGAEFSQWAQFISHLLEAAGWPGERALTRLEQEVVESWKQALSALSALGLGTPSVTWAKALRHLRQLTETAGPAAGDLASPIQVLDAADVLELRFDRLWATGLADENWPPRRTGVAFIPLALQRLAGISGATPETRKRQNRRLSHAIQCAGDAVWGSFSPTDAESARLSPLFFVTGEPQPPSAILSWRQERLWDRIPFAELEQRDDSMAPPVAEGHEFTGGTSLIRDQSDCPFRAFAARRLRAIAPEEGTFAFDPLDRGNFLHQALEVLWSELGTRERLRALTLLERAELIEHSIDTALNRDEVSTMFRQQLRLAEKERMTAVIEAWLSLEERRLVDFSVAAVEQDRVVQIGPLRVRVRADRVDQLAGGGLLLIDYKSGKPRAEHLMGDRPEAPQLLVYAATATEAVDGVCFAKLSPRAEEAVGYVRRAHFGGSKETPLGLEWGIYLDQSKRTVTALACSFAEGVAVVDPRNRKACEYCAMKPLCRIEEQRKNSADNGDE